MAEDKVPRDAGSPPHASSVGVARAKFGFRMAATRVGAVMEKALGGRAVSSWEGGAGLYVICGMSCEVTQEPGGWRSFEVVGRVSRRV